MNFWKILFLGLLLWVLVLVDKYLAFEILGFTTAWHAWLYYILIVIFARILSRQIGVINILEACFAGIIWVLMVLVLDSFVAKRFLSPEVFLGKHYWLSFFAIFVSVFFLHRKRHIQIRKEQASHHGH